MSTRLEFGPQSRAALEADRPVRLASGIYLLAVMPMLLYTAAVATFGLSGFPDGLQHAHAWPYLADKPVGEDGYYLMLAAWNLGAGHGLTANFGQAATGVQPLMTLVLAACARLLQEVGYDKIALARVVVLLGGALLAAFAVLMARMAQRLAPAHDKTAALAAFILAATSFYLWRTFTYGLETGLYLVLVAVLLERFLALPQQPPRRALVQLGILTGLCGLARIDFGLVVAIALVALLLTRRLRLREVVLVGGIALLLTAPWFVYLKLVSGHWLPTSGPAQSRLIDASNAWSRIEAMICSLAQNLLPSLPLPGTLWSAALALTLVALCLARTRAAGLRRLLPWIVGVGSLPLAYTIFFWAAHFYARYTALTTIFGILLVAFAISRWAPARTGKVMLALATLCLVINTAAAWRDLHQGQVGDGHAVTAGYVAHQLPPTSRVGAFQSGVTGYYNANVINLDGKLNQDALDALRSGRMEDYLDRAGIDYVVDWKGVIDDLLPQALSSGRWEQCPHPVPNLETICIRRR